jgi:hypothetical protein
MRDLPQTASAAVPPDAEPRPRAGDAPLLADLPFDAPDTLAGWLVAAGSGLAAVAFLLPWADGLYGAGNFTGSFTDDWGLGNPSHLLVLLGAVSVLALAVVPNRLPAWLRGGVLPILLGGLLLGLVWPYFFASRAQIGALLAIGSGAVLVIGGMLALRPRHGGGGQSV